DVGLVGDTREQLAQRLVVRAQRDAAVDAGVEVEFETGVAPDGEQQLGDRDVAHIERVAAHGPGRDWRGSERVRRCGCSLCIGCTFAVERARRFVARLLVPGGGWSLPGGSGSAHIEVAEWGLRGLEG